MIVRIVVADEREASFFDAESMNTPLKLVSKIEDPKGGLRGRDLESDRPGRSFDSMGAHRHAMDGERSSRRWHEQTEFARRIVEDVEQARQGQKFDRLVVIAGPRMLGLIREALPAPARTLIVAEITKDIGHLDEKAIRSYLPREAFTRTSAGDA